MTDQPDLFADLPSLQDSKPQEPTEEEVSAAVEETRKEDGLDLPRAYVRDMLAGRDPTNPDKGMRYCGACGNCQPDGPGCFCEMSALTVGTSDPAGDCIFFARRK